MGRKKSVLTADMIRADMEFLTIDEICRSYNITRDEFWKFFEGEERAELEKVLAQENKMQRLHGIAYGEIEIKKQRRLIENYKMKPFDLSVNEQIVAYDSVMETFAIFTVCEILERTFTAKKGNVTRMFQKSDYQFGSIARLTDEIKDVQNIMLCGWCGKIIRKTPNRKWCKKCITEARRELTNEANKERLKLKRYEAIVNSTLNDALKDCREQNKSYAERQKAETLEREGHGKVKEFRNCEKCIYNIGGSCAVWECEGTVTVEMAREAMKAKKGK